SKGDKPADERFVRFVDHRVRSRPNDPSSATRPTGRVNCNQSAMAGLDAMKGCEAWAKRAHAGYEKQYNNPS
ncbi:MAG: hypothetical protein ACRD2R_06070, partial [Terriglobales bacterium]